MAIPGFQEIMLPLLQHVADGKEYTLAGTRDTLAEFYNLTDEERKQRLPSGGAETFYNRVAWAKTYLERAGLLERIKRGLFKISPRGLEVLAESPQKIDISFLKRFPEFDNFRTKSGGDPSPEESADNVSTPEEALEDAYQQLRDDLAAEILTAVKTAPPDFFERLVVDLMLRMGYGGPGDDAGSVTPYGGDGGIDGIINEDYLGLDSIYLQAKRWEANVGRPELQKFVGALHGRRARKGVFITTSGFSQDATSYVRTIDPRVVLIDGLKLAELMIDYGVGVSTAREYKVKRIDSDYFEHD